MTEAPSGQSKSLEELLAEGVNASATDASAGADVAVVTTDYVAATPNPADIIQHIPVQLIVDSPWQPRTKYDETQLQALGETMRARGQDEPIQVRKLPNGTFELIAGHRRIRAARMIGWPTIAAQVIVADDRTAELATLVSNETQVGLSDFEKGKAYQQSIDRGFAKDQGDVGRIFACSQARVSQCLSLLKLPAPITHLLDQYPGLFGYKYAKVIKDLIGAYPEGLEAIVLGVEQLIDNSELEPVALQVFVEKLLKKRSRATPTKPTLIPNKSGTALFSVKVTEKQIVIDIKENFDSSMVSKRTMAALRELAQSVEAQ